VASGRNQPRGARSRIAVIKSEGWTTVQAGFKQNSDGDYEELVLVKSTDGTGLKIKGPSARNGRTASPRPV
jgi:hypothetical protein